MGLPTASLSAMVTTSASVARAMLVTVSTARSTFHHATVSHVTKVPSVQSPPPSTVTKTPFASAQPDTLVMARTAAQWAHATITTVTVMPSALLMALFIQWVSNACARTDLRAMV